MIFSEKLTNFAALQACIQTLVGCLRKRPFPTMRSLQIVKKVEPFVFAKKIYDKNCNYLKVDGKTSSLS